MLARIGSRARVALTRCAALLVLAFPLAGQSFAGTVTLAWDAVALPAVTGYKVHHGAAAGSYTTAINVGNVTSYTVPNLTEGSTYHFAITAYDAAGNIAVAEWADHPAAGPREYTGTLVRRAGDVDRPRAPGEGGLATADGLHHPPVYLVDTAGCVEYEDPMGVPSRDLVVGRHGAEIPDVDHEVGGAQALDAAGRQAA